MTDLYSGQVVGYFGTKDIYKVLASRPVNGRILTRNLLDGIPHSLKIEGILPLRIGPFQINTDSTSVYLYNISGYTVNIGVCRIKDQCQAIVGHNSTYLIRDCLDEEDRKLWDIYAQEILSDTSPSYENDPCLFDGHEWVDTGMQVSYCKRCEAKGRYDTSIGTYRFVEK